MQHLCFKNPSSSPGLSGSETHKASLLTVLKSEQLKCFELRLN